MEDEISGEAHQPMEMIAKLRTVIRRWFQPTVAVSEAEPASCVSQIPEFKKVNHEDTALKTRTLSLVSFDENLLERARTQWQFGDWQSLARLNYETLQNHPDRAKLALLAAAGRLQTEQYADARHYIRLAQDWGVSKKLLTRILAAGVHNSLGRAAAIAGEHPRALQHFESSIVIGTPSSDCRLLSQARVYEQFNQVGLPVSSLSIVPRAQTLSRDL